MSASAGQKPKRISPAPSEHLQLVRIKPDHRSIYFKNNGLFAENYLLNRLPNERSDTFVMQHWETIELEEFNECYEWMLSAWDEYKDILPTLSEAQLEDKWIRPILEKLGWAYEVQDRLQKRGKTQIPDYSLFSSTEQYKRAKGCKNNDKYFSYVEAIADAKAMGTSLDGTGHTNSNPSYQIVRYLEDTGRDWGILTDGEYWRLYSKKSKSKYTTFYEVNVRKVLAGRNDSPRDDEGFKYFFNFFRRASFAERDAAGKNFLDVVFESGERYAKEVETQLKERAFRIVESIARGFAGDKPPQREDQLAELYRYSLYYLFRLIFTLNCESKGILDIKDLSDYYSHSLRSIAAKLKDEFEKNISWSARPKTYKEVSELFDLLKSGDSSISIKGFGEEPFIEGEKFFKTREISDIALNKALVELACSYSEEGELQFIDYGRLGADHLGSIFEGLLEYKLTVAPQNYYVDAKGKIVDAGANPPKALPAGVKELIRKGQLYLATGSGERKASGAYYTPDYVVDFIVDRTLRPICDGLKAEEIFSIKVCDPAMGSGHFLVGVVRFLEEQVMRLLYKEGEKTAEIDPMEIRWRVLHECIYGVDINPLAVELAKFSLWILSATNLRQLEPLSDQLKCSDSLFSNWKDLFPKTKFSAFVGNPPYKVEYAPKYKSALTETFSSFRLPQNIFTCFIERIACEFGEGREGLRFGFIMPNTFAKGDTYKEFRAILSENVSSKVMDLGGRVVFKDANVYTAIVLGKRLSGTHPIQYAKVPIEADVREWDSFECSELSIDGGGGAILSKYSSLPRIGDLCEVKDVGFNYWSKGRGKKRGGSIADRVLYEGKQQSKKDMPYVKGRDFEKFTLKFADRYLIHNWADQLAPEDTFRFSEQYFNLPERVCYRQTANELIATMVPKGYGNDKTVHIVVPNEGTISNRLLLGCLNSSLFTQMYRELVDEQGQAFAQVKTVVVKKLPLPIPKSAEGVAAAKKIEEIVDKGLKSGSWSKVDQETLDSLVARLLDACVSKSKGSGKAA